MCIRDRDGSVWMFQEYHLTEPSLKGYVQTVALDVSEIYYNSEEIKRNNEKLAKLNQKLEEMYERIGDEIREQETLSMKMQVHDNFGRSLLSIRKILGDKESPENMKEQLETLKQQVYILTNTTVANKENQYEDTERHAEDVYKRQHHSRLLVIPGYAPAVPQTQVLSVNTVDHQNRDTELMLLN